jgi:hypothetical protein
VWRLELSFAERIKHMAKNAYKEVVFEGVTCVEFVTGGKNMKKVLVDKKAWEEYLHEYHWTAIKIGNYISIKSSRNKHSVRLHRVIVEHENSELDYWGNTIDHRNNNPLDNRRANLRIYNSKLNATNIKSKYQLDNNHLIHKQPGVGYKVHTNIFDETIYKNFRTVDEARVYRDQVVIPYIQQRIAEMTKKSRDIEFERGLRDKLQNGEKEEVIVILKKYGVGS